MGFVIRSFMQINYVNIVWWQEYLSCISDIPKSAEEGKFAAAWQYSRKLITQERIYENLQSLLLFTCFCKGEALACSIPESTVPSCMLFHGLKMSLVPVASFSLKCLLVSQDSAQLSLLL